MSGLAYRLFFPYGYRVVTREVYRSSLKRLVTISFVSHTADHDFCPFSDPDVDPSVLVCDMSIHLSIVILSIHLSIVILSIHLSIVILSIHLSIVILSIHLSIVILSIHFSMSVLPQQVCSVLVWSVSRSLHHIMS